MGDVSGDCSLIFLHELVKVDANGVECRGALLEKVVEYVPWYANKLEVKRYLEEVNKDKKVSLEHENSRLVII